MTQQFSASKTCVAKLMPSSVVEALYNLNIIVVEVSFNLNMLITRISMKAKWDRRTMRREKETAEIAAKLHGK